MVRAVLTCACLLAASAVDASGQVTTEHMGLLQQKNRGQVGEQLQHGIQAHSVDAPTLTFNQADCTIVELNFWGIACPSKVLDDLRTLVNAQKDDFQSDLDATQAKVDELEVLMAEHVGVATAEIAGAEELIAAIEAATEKAQTDRTKAQAEYVVAAGKLQDSIAELTDRLQSAQGKANEAASFIDVAINGPAESVLQTKGWWEDAKKKAAQLVCKGTDLWDGLYCHNKLMEEKGNMQQELNILDAQLVKLRSDLGRLSPAKSLADVLTTLKVTYKEQADEEDKVLDDLKKELDKLEAAAKRFSELLLAAEAAVHGPSEQVEDGN